jgi:CheY-like chemotaxis protein
MSLPVLIVDDDPQIRSLVRAVLSKHRFPTVEAADGLSALSTVRKMNGAIGLMVGDFSMPGLDGDALARLVKAQFPTTPILLMSSERTACESTVVDAFPPNLFCLPCLLTQFGGYTENGLSRNGNAIDGPVSHGARRDTGEQRRCSGC